MKAAIYLRVSTDEQKTDSQRHDIEKWLETHPTPGAVWYEDKYSGKTLNRPMMKKLRKEIADGNINILIVQRLDRVSRKLLNGLVFLSELADKGVRIVAVRQQIDLEGPMGKLVAAILLAVAEMELTLRAERQRAGIDAVMKEDAGKPKHLRRFRGPVGRKPGPRSGDPKDVMALLEKGLTHNQVASVLRISPRTVCNYRHRYFKEQEKLAKKREKEQQCLTQNSPELSQ